MEPLKLRILLSYDQGTTIAYLYNRKSFDLLKIEKHTYDESQFLEVGDSIEYEGMKFVVKNINFKMEKELHEMDSKYGINMYSPTDPSDFNCEMGVFVDNA